MLLLPVPDTNVTLLGYSVKQRESLYLTSALRGCVHKLSVLSDNMSKH